MLFDPTSRYLLTAGDKHIRILHNVPGCKVNIEVRTRWLGSSCENPANIDVMLSY